MLSVLRNVKFQKLFETRNSMNFNKLKVTNKTLKCLAAPQFRPITSVNNWPKLRFNQEIIRTLKITKRFESTNTTIEKKCCQRECCQRECCQRECYKDDPVGDTCAMIVVLVGGTLIFLCVAGCIITPIIFITSWF